MKHYVVKIIHILIRDAIHKADKGFFFYKVSFGGFKNIVIRV